MLDRMGNVAPQVFRCIVSGDTEPEVEGRRRYAGELASDACHRPALEVAPPLVGRDPLVDADLRRRFASIGTLGDRLDVLVAVHQTFCTAARPRSPFGRTSITAIRIAKTIACWKVDEM